MTFRDRAAALMTILTLVSGAAPLLAEWSVDVTVDCDDGMNIWPEGPHVGTGPTIAMAEEDGRQMACYMCENLGGACGEYTYENYQEIMQKKSSGGVRDQTGYSFRFRFPNAPKTPRERDVVGLGDTLIAAFRDARARAERSKAHLGGLVEVIREPTETDAVPYRIKGQIAGSPFAATGSPGETVTIALTNKAAQPIGLNVLVGDADRPLLTYQRRITIPAAQNDETPGKIEFKIQLHGNITPRRFPIGFRTDDKQELAHIVMHVVNKEE